MRTSPQPGDYLTDGTGLFRVVRHFHCSGERYAELEDCRTLELLLSSCADLDRPALRLVRHSVAHDIRAVEPALA